MQEIGKCCNELTRYKARDTKELKSRAVLEEEEKPVNTLGLIRLAERKVEKKTRQRENRSTVNLAKEAVYEKDAEVITIN